ncbi:MAG: hypothetical protein JJ863_20555 [Deltaproteobacteria bacterium]|nr:hypothetical protein [Deltaproteobacteria bacterium]
MTPTRTALLLGALLGALFISPNPAAADTPGERLSVEGYFIGGFAGQYRLRVDGERYEDRDLDLDPTLGGGIRIATGHIFRFGLMAELRGYGSSDSDYSDRDFAFDLSPFIGVRVPLVESNDSGLYLRGIVPFGYTRLAPDEQRFGDDSYHGFNTGVLGGLGVRFGNVGLFADVGVRYHRVYAKTDLGPFGDLRSDLSWAQLSVNAGVAAHF